MNHGKRAVGSQPRCQVARPDREPLAAAERMLIRFYRQLDEGEQAFMRRAIEAMARRKAER